MHRNRRLTTHKRNTNLVHIACGIAALYVLFIWGFGPKFLDIKVTDAGTILQTIAWVEIINLTQYAGKSAYDHKHGVFDTVIQGAATGDIATGAAQVASALLHQNEGENQ